MQKPGPRVAWVEFPRERQGIGPGGMLTQPSASDARLGIPNFATRCAIYFGAKLCLPTHFARHVRRR